MEVASSDIIKYLQAIEQYTEDYGVASSVSGVSSLSSPKPSCISWCSKKRYNIANTKLAVLIVGNDFEGDVSSMLVIKVLNPRYAFAKVLSKFFVVEASCAGVHETARIAPDVTLSEGVSIAENVVIKSGCSVGENTCIASGVVLHEDIVVGRNVSIASNTVLGTSGFGYVKNSKNQYEPFPHLGGVRIEDNVDIGAQTCIDRGAIDDTIISEGTKIDNLCHIAHNVFIGKNCVVTAGVVVAGSVRIEDNVWLAPSSTLLNGITVGENSFVGIGAVVIRNVRSNKKVFGNPAKVIGDV